jgi:hypothetical protein
MREWGDPPEPEPGMQKEANFWFACLACGVLTVVLALA